MFEQPKLYIEIDVTRCEEVIPKYPNQLPCFKLFWAGGSCKSDVEVTRSGRYRFQAVVNVYEGRAYFRAIRKVKGPVEKKALRNDVE